MSRVSPDSSVLQASSTVDYMCGIHAGDGSPVNHHHDLPSKDRPQVFRPSLPSRSRRAFLGDVGRGAMALAVVTPATLAACSSSPGPAVVAGSDDAAPAAAADDSADELRWARANLGFVSAYVLARGNQATIVDTGVAGSARAIGESLGTLGLNYSDVQHVILTHNHQDHAGSIGEVIAEAVNAKVYAGAADIDGVDQRPIEALSGGEDIFGFEMLATPGHTAGHMCVIDHAAGLLVAGDAIFGEEGGVVEGPERFFADVEQSRQSIRALGNLTFNTLLFGHGEPIENRADTAVAALAASFS